MKIQLDLGAYAPTRAHDTDAGLDLYSRERKIIPANGSAVFRTGVHVEIPEYCAGLIVSKSGLNIQLDVTSEGLIDQGYTGEIVVKLYNNGHDDVLIMPGQKISQLVIFRVLYEPVEIVDEIEGGERGNKGFGSTGW